jgi:hypothetical protein
MERVMTMYGFSLAATIIMLFPMLYFFIVTPTFFLMTFNDPVVTWLLRKLFSVYFRTVGICCGLAVAAFVIAGRPVIAICIVLMAWFAVAARRWFLHQMDTQLSARDAGDINAVSRLRRLQMGGMLYNAVQLVVIFASIPFVFGTVT